MRSRLIIAIDGPAGAGKSTVARRLAARLGYRFLDTGALYRAVTVAVLRAGLDPSDEAGVSAVAEAADVRLGAGPGGQAVLLDGADVTEESRGPAASTAVSTVAAMPRVRAAMIPLQREFARGGGVVAEGRDIGTVVFPDADLKVFLDADPAERAIRRARERGEGDVESVRREIAERDAKDVTRAVSPLAAAPDALRIDSTGRAIEEIVDLLAERVGNAERNAAARDV